MYCQAAAGSSSSSRILLKAQHHTTARDPATRQKRCWSCTSTIPVGETTDSTGKPHKLPVRPVDDTSFSGKSNVRISVIAAFCPPLPVPRASKEKGGRNHLRMWMVRSMETWGTFVTQMLHDLADPMNNVRHVHDDVLQLGTSVPARKCHLHQVTKKLPAARPIELPVPACRANRCRV